MKIGGATMVWWRKPMARARAAASSSSVAKRRAITCTSAGTTPRQIPHRPTNRFRRSVKPRLETVQALNKNLSGQALAASLLDKLCHQETDKLEEVLSALIDRTKYAFIPLGIL